MADDPAAEFTDGTSEAPPGDAVAEDVLVEDVLVEEVSIDGMCGVY